jgi:hypothetical protein
MHPIGRKHGFICADPVHQDPAAFESGSERNHRIRRPLFTDLPRLAHGVAAASGDAVASYAVAWAAGISWRDLLHQEHSDGSARRLPVEPVANKQYVCINLAYL